MHKVYSSLGNTILQRQELTRILKVMYYTEVHGILHSLCDLCTIHYTTTHVIKYLIKLELGGDNPGVDETENPPLKPNGDLCPTSPCGNERSKGNWSSAAR